MSIIKLKKQLKRKLQKKEKQQKPKRSGKFLLLFDFLKPNTAIGIAKNTIINFTQNK